MTTLIRCFYTLLALSIACFAAWTHAGEADIIDVQMMKVGERQYTISVTVQHADTGWDHYANQWQVFDLQGQLLGTRTLHHPHVNEQPFTRSLTLTIPQGIDEVRIVAGDSVHENGGQEMQVAVPR